MNKKFFLLLVLLMSISLIGIIFIQGYWIKSTVDEKEKQFSIRAKQVLINVSKDLQNREIEEFWFELNKTDSSLNASTEVNLEEHFPIDTEKQKQADVADLIGEDRKILSGFLAAEEDSLNFSELLNKKTSGLPNVKEVEVTGEITTEKQIERLIGMKEVEKNLLRKYIAEASSRIPISRRVSKERIESLLAEELRNNNLSTDFEYAVYNSSLPTKIHSEDFDLEHSATYAVPLFANAKGKSDYQLVVNFTDKDEQVLSSAVMMGLLAVLFTLIIVVAYSSSLSQLIKQRQISQIKTDFINNMTHEFKTPIATINLALDAIKNPKIINDEEKVSRYLHMIREENKRMHAQVENVLQISRLEKNELNLKKERLHLHELIEEAITHVELIVENREGYIKTHFGALKSSVLANRDHMVNVIVNILDNAIKYSAGEPKIDIYTENVKNYIVTKVRDQGSGMSKSTQKKIFDKFYREHTGDIHNVKGHGLGLAYTRQILEDHHGTITVESEKGKGSTFIIKLPLIT